ncbi:MAG: hypothetical protein ACLVKO_03955 [Dysgonomonas sp.]
MKKDAERAAELVNKSKEATLNYDLESAEKFYKEYQEIKNKYKNTDNNNEFEKTYWEYLTNAKK